MKNFSKQSDETIKDYKIRLFREKEIYDLTLDEIRDLINDVTGEYKATDTYRKWYTPYNEGFEDGFNKAMSDNNLNSILEEIEEKRTEIVKERYKLQATKTEYNRKLRQYSRFELFYENIKDAIQELPEIERMFSPKNIDKYSEAHVLTISDIHYNSNFDSLNNTYSRQECLDRFKILFNVLVNEIKENEIDNLKIINLGDTIQGMLRISDLSLNETTVVASVVEISRILANFINELSAYCNIEYYHVPMSNHTQVRPLNTKASELAYEDMEYVIVNYIYDLTKDKDGITVYKDYPYDFITFNILNTSCIAMHGHQVKNIKEVLKDLSIQHRKFYDVCFMGHYHSYSEFQVGIGDTNNTKVLVAPPFIGSCPYSDKLMKGVLPEVKLHKFNDKYGHIASKNIILAERR